jgi:glycosyltransferase involved in cell wall biosynthesis
VSSSIGISIIVPVYNEHTSIQSTVEQLVGLCSDETAPVEIILVNDGSNDGTEEYLNTLNHQAVRVLTHSKNKGYGAAIKSGIKASQYPYIGITDADGTYPNHRFPEFLSEIHDHQYDMVVGSRVGSGVQIPFIRRPAKWCLNQFANFLINQKIPDLNSGFRIVKIEVFEKFFNILPSGFSLTTTITLATLSNDMEVKFIPIDYNARRGKSKIRPIYDTLNFVQLIIRVALYFNPLRVFIPLSMMFLLVGIMVPFFSWFLLGKIADVSSGILLMASVIVLAIGMLADLIVIRMR